MLLYIHEFVWFESYGNVAFLEKQKAWRCTPESNQWGISKSYKNIQDCTNSYEIATNT